MIPAKLRSFPHWIVWRYITKHGKPTKVPFNPKTEQLADPSNIDHCGTYDLCQYLVEEGRFDGKGFVFSDHSPFTGIDLDSPFVRLDKTHVVEDDHDFDNACAVRASHWRIIEEFRSYTEWSPSGIGAHIIVEGKVSEARKQGKIELYSRERFFTITGNTDGLPVWDIASRQAALDVFVSRLGPGLSAMRDVYDREQTLSDDEVVTRCRSELFDRLWIGQDDTGYKSGSEADQAFGNLIGQNTDNLEQCVRVFMSSPRYQHVRTKLHSRFDLVQRACRRSFDMKSPPIDFDALTREAATFVKQTEEQQLENPYAHLMRQIPPGLLGGIMEFLFYDSPRPIFEISLSASIALMSGIVGRSYNVGSLGLAQYVVLLAASGTGKESMSGGIGRLMAAVTQNVPAATSFIGPSYIASAQAITKELSKNPSFVTIFAEYGVILGVMLDPRSNANNQIQRATYLDLYGKNGGKNVLGRSVYSDTDKNSKTVTSPAFTSLGESVPELFYDAVNGKTISEGYIPRLLVIEHKGPNVPFNANAGLYAPKQHLVDALATLCARSLETNNKINSGGDANQVALSYEVAELRTALDAWIINLMNASDDMNVKALWSRVVQKTMKLAAVRAVGINWMTPTIERADFEWALAFSLSDVYRMLDRIKTGEISSGAVENDREKAFLSALRRYFTLKPSSFDGYKIPAKLFDARVIPIAYIQTACYAVKCFKSPLNGERKKAVDDAIAQAVANDWIREVPLADVEKIDNSRRRAFVLGKGLPAGE